tara:strand:+ start:4426 stop:5235 length:810 start_codon:yes stop_codon:yes gene_type:complete
MNPITKALSELKFRIPKPILEKAFLPKKTWGGLHHKTPVSLDYRIREAVIDARVMVDCNLVGGTEVTVPLGDIVPQYLPEYKVIWRIPLNLTQNRNITRVYSLIYGDGGVPSHTNMYNTGGSVYDDAASGLLASHMPIPNISNAEIQLIGENTVLAHMHIPPSPRLYLRCVVENDGEFNNLPPTSILRFCKLVEFATKSYIYNNLMIEMDRGELSGGSDLGRFSSMVEDYADAEELYQEYFEEHWRKIALFSDPKAHKRHLKMVTGGRH